MLLLLLELLLLLFLLMMVLGPLLVAGWPGWLTGGPLRPMSLQLLVRRVPGQAGVLGRVLGRVHAAAAGHGQLASAWTWQEDGVRPGHQGHQGHPLLRVLQHNEAAGRAPSDISPRAKLIRLCKKRGRTFTTQLNPQLINHNCFLFFAALRIVS